MIRCTYRKSRKGRTAFLAIKVNYAVMKVLETYGLERNDVEGDKKVDVAEMESYFITSRIPRH